MSEIMEYNDVYDEIPESISGTNNIPGRYGSEAENELLSETNDENSFDADERELQEIAKKLKNSLFQNSNKNNNSLKLKNNVKETKTINDDNEIDLNKKFIKEITNVYDLIYKPTNTHNDIINSEIENIDDTNFLDEEPDLPKTYDRKTYPHKNISLSSIMRKMYNLMTIKYDVSATSLKTESSNLNHIIALIDGLFLFKPIDLPEIISKNSNYLTTYNMIVLYPSVFLWFHGNCKIMGNLLNKDYTKKNNVFDSLIYKPPPITPINLYLKNMISMYTKKYNKMDNDKYLMCLQNLLECNIGNGKILFNRIDESIYSPWTETDNNLSHLWLFNDIRIQNLYKKTLFFLEIKNRELSKVSNYYANIICS